MKKFYLLLGLLFLMTAGYQAMSSSKRLASSDPLRGREAVVLCIGDVILSSQAEVDAFDCEVIQGNLIISGADINNLDALQNLKSVNGYLEIANNASLETVNGFDALRNVAYGVRIHHNPALILIDGFNALDSVSGNSEIITMTFTSNPSLLNLQGFSSLQEISTDYGGYVNFSIEDNARLERITAFSSLTYIAGTFAYFNIRHNPNLVNLEGFSNLGDITGGILGEFWIEDNDALTNLDGFSSLKSVSSTHGSIYILDNEALQNVDALYDFRLIGRPGLVRVKDNPSLTRGCGLYKVLQPVPPPPGHYHTIEISGNGPGCTREEIEANGPCLDFAVDKSTICAGDAITFTVKRSAPATNLQWNFGEGAEPATATGDGPHVVRYSNGGLKNIELRATGFIPVVVASLDITINQLPLNKHVVAEFPAVCPGKGTNVIVVDHESNVMYQLRNDQDGSAVSGLWPGTVGLFTGPLSQSMVYQVYAVNSATGCHLTMTEKPSVAVVRLRADTEVVAESPSGPPGHATNIIVVNGDPHALYVLRNDVNDEPVAGPWPSSVGLYTGPLYATTTFNVLSYVAGASGCEQELATKVVVTIGDQTLAANENQRLGDVSISPQPCDGNFDVQINNQASGNYEVIVCDMVGHIVADRKISKQDFSVREPFNVTDAPKGLYIVSVVCNGSTSNMNMLAVRKRLVIK